MALTKDEKLGLYDALLNKDYPQFTRLVKASRYLSKDEKINVFQALSELIWGDDPEALSRLTKALVTDE